MTTATIDFVSCSPPIDTGESYALVELRSLRRDHTLANPGAVFGGLVSMGGFAMITGDPGTGKSVVLRALAEQFERQPDLDRRRDQSSAEQTSPGRS